MKRLFISLVVAASCVMSAAAQQYRQDTRSENQKLDEYNEYNAENIPKTQILKALELTGVRLFNFQLPETTKQQQAQIIIDEYKEHKWVNADTITVPSTYEYDAGDSSYMAHSNREVHLIVQSDFKDSLVYMEITGDWGFEALNFDKIPRRYYGHRAWVDYGNFKVGQKEPLYIYASSWQDEQNPKMYRFCGMINLRKDDMWSKDFFENSPHYYLLSYLITEK